MVAGSICVSKTSSSKVANGFTEEGLFGPEKVAPEFKVVHSVCGVSTQHVGLHVKLARGVAASRDIEAGARGVVAGVGTIGGRTAAASAIRGSADHVDANGEIGGPEVADTVTDFELVVDDSIAVKVESTVVLLDLACTNGIFKLEYSSAIGGDDTNAKDQSTEFHRKRE
jgi:hypothetical protein